MWFSIKHHWAAAARTTDILQAPTAPQFYGDMSEDEPEEFNVGGATSLGLGRWAIYRIEPSFPSGIGDMSYFRWFKYT